MTEDGQTAPPAAGDNTVPTSMITEDGSFVENWPAMLSDETLHEDKTLRNFKNIEGLAKSYVHARKQIPMNKTAVPNENWGDDDWDTWYEAGGRPATPQDYNIQKPQDFPDELWNQDNANSAQDLFHRIGLNQNQVNEILKWNNELSLNTMKAQQDAQNAMVTEVEDALHKDWGAAYDQKVRIGNLAIEKGVNGDAEFKQRLLDKINRDPDLIKFASNLGGKFIEAGAPMPNIPTPGEMDDLIKEEMAKKSYTDRNHPDHKSQVQKVKRLFEERDKNLKTGFI